ncbi:MULTISPECIES: hypothetical protein [Halomonas]|uniref:Uncharacterized protein n=1 Tax=Halomonas ventosae TaxID=229007 RepID=A0A4V3BY68_9GAMM|nr:hypothetical protein [Halomonas ventosae]TDO01469.1 hypothetical protein DFO68_12113 [Halomonas ventosae]
MTVPVTPLHRTQGARLLALLMLGLGIVALDKYVFTFRRPQKDRS